MAGTPTIKDVAKLAGVSISTVSRVMNDSKPVSPESRRKVLDAIQKLDFKPNELARSLVMKRSNLIGVVVKDIGIPYMASIIRGIEEIGKMYKFDILLSSSYGDEDSELDTVQFMFTKQVDGVILISENTTERVVDAIKEHRLPFIILDRIYEQSRINTVDVDYEQAVQLVVEFFEEMGHSRILLAGQQKSSRSGAEKFAAFREAIRKRGWDEHFVAVSGTTYKEYAAAGEAIVQYCKKHSITGVFCMDDTLAIALMNHLKDTGTDVPGDISVFGFGDDPFSSIYRPMLSTVRIPYYDIGAIAMRKLIKHLRKEELMSESTVVPTQLVKRDSVAKLA